MRTSCRIFVLVLFITSCEGLFEYSPFDADVGSRNINSEHIAKIVATRLSDDDTLRFAVFSDVHDSYNDMLDALQEINGRKDIRFIISNGDVTNAGLAQEFEWYADNIPESNVPVVTAIGNHDCLANGLLIFERMFGPSNTSFETGNYKFILFSSVLWENNLASPDYEWLRAELDNDLHNIIVSHLPPESTELGALYRMLYKSIVDSSNTSLALHAHSHSYSEYKYNGVPNLVTATIKKREYYVIEAIKGEYRIIRVNF